MTTDDPSYKIPRLLRYRDLKARGVCSNWTTLLRWIKAGTFPAGRLIGPNTRARPQARRQIQVARLPCAVAGS